MSQGAGEFVRPASVPMPTVWSRFRGLKSMPDGKTPDFWVQCIPPEDDDAVVEFMVKHFIPEEEIAKALNFSEHPEAVEEFCLMWRKVLGQRVSLAVWTTWPQGKPRIAGCNVLNVAYKGEPKIEGKTDLIQKCLRGIYTLIAKTDPFEIYGCDQYLSGFGLSVAGEFRGQGLGLELLKAREPLCRAVGIKATVTIFSGAASQKVSERAGFKTLAELRYHDYVDNGEAIYKNVTGVESMLIKGRLIPGMSQGASEFVRPSSLAMPTVWSRFRGSRAMGDGRVPDFWVQCVRPEDDDAVVAIMEKHFLREEETSRAVKFLESPEAVTEIRSTWRKLLQQRVSLAAWTGWPDGTPRLVGCNVLFVAHKSDPKVEGQCSVTRRVFRSLNAASEKVDPFALYGCDQYLSAMGLSALPEFRGQALGLELLKARAPLCRALGLKATVTIFTGIASQKLSERAGFKTLAELRYREYVDEGEIVYKDVKGVEAMLVKGWAIPKDP